MVCYAITVRGRVQGVGFRWFCQQHANALQIKGWVRNAPDGSVALKVNGTPKHIKEYISLLNKGPLHSHVEEVIARKEKEEPFVNFEVL